jgi:esterase/lipase superfamily enzyme
MGNIVALAAFEKIALRGNSKSHPIVGELILAHPDVDKDRFRQLINLAREICAGMTLYTSRSDMALWASKLLRGIERAGGSRSVLSGVDTIDITGLGTSYLNINHSVFSANPVVFSDIARLIGAGTRPPHKRTDAFEEVKGREGTYWRFRRSEGKKARR